MCKSSSEEVLNNYVVFGNIFVVIVIPLMGHHYQGDWHVNIAWRSGLSTQQLKIAIYIDKSCDITHVSSFSNKGDVTNTYPATLIDSRHGEPHDTG